MTRATKRQRWLGALCLVGVVAGAVYVVLGSATRGDRQDQPSAAVPTSLADAAAEVEPADVLPPEKLELLRSVTPDPSCPDPETAQPGENEVVLEVLRVVDACLVVEAVVVSVAAAAAEAAALRAEPSVVAAGTTPTPTLHQIPDRRGEQWSLDALGVPPGSDEVPWPTGAGAVVAVLDTGIDAEHVDLQGAVINRWAGPRPSDLDPDGHGTHVAGIIAGRANDFGIVGIAPDVDVLDVPVELNVEDPRDPDQEIAVNEGRTWPSGLIWAVNHGAQVVNMSFGQANSTIDETSASVAMAAVEYAQTNDVVLLAAAGNCGPSGGEDCKGTNRLEVPAVFSNVIGVGAVNPDRHLSGFSTRNATVDIVAPGGEGSWDSKRDILSTLPGGIFDYGRGTSQASPHVAGAAAVLRSISPDRSARQIASALVASAEDLPLKEERSSVGAGSGLLDVEAAVALVERPNRATPEEDRAPQDVTARELSDQQLVSMAACDSPCVVSGRIPIDHPRWGATEVVTIDGGTEATCAQRLIFAVGPTGELVWDGGVGVDGCPWYDIQPALDLENPVDAAGRIFINWNPGRYNGVTALTVTEEGFDDHGTLPAPDYQSGRFYYASVVDPDGDGVFDILASVNNCYPGCAQGDKADTLYRFARSDFVGVPETTPTDCGTASLDSEYLSDGGYVLSDVAADVTVTGLSCDDLLLDRSLSGDQPALLYMIGDARELGDPRWAFVAGGFSCTIPGSAPPGHEPYYEEYSCSGRGEVTFTRYQEPSRS